MAKLTKPEKNNLTTYTCYTNESTNTNTAITVGVTAGASVVAAVITIG